MTSESLDKIPIWSESDSENSFIFINESITDDYKERIPVTRIENWETFFELVNSEFFDRTDAKLIFRGHRRWDWDLSPTLARSPYSTNGCVTEEDADEMHSLFRKAVRGRLTDSNLVNDEHYNELWAVGQHYGLKTPLLDWTKSPYVALFFAFHKQDSINEKIAIPYRAIYVLNESFTSKKCSDIQVFEPKRDDHGRLVNQAGLFTICYDKTLEDQLQSSLRKSENLLSEDEDISPNMFAKYICKILIKNEFQAECIKHLRKMNIHPASLFPDLIGASEYCNIVMNDWIKENRFELDLESPDEVDFITSPYKLEISERYLVAIKGILLSHIANDQIEIEEISSLTNNLFDELKNSQFLGWTEENVKAKIRTITRSLLRKAKYPESKWDAISLSISDLIIDAPQETAE